MVEHRNSLRHALQPGTGAWLWQTTEARMASSSLSTTALSAMARRACGRCKVHNCAHNCGLASHACVNMPVHADKSSSSQHWKHLKASHLLPTNLDASNSIDMIPRKLSPPCSTIVIRPGYAKHNNEAAKIRVQRSRPGQVHAGPGPYIHPSPITCSHHWLACNAAAWAPGNTASVAVTLKENTHRRHMHRHVHDTSPQCYSTYVSASVVRCCRPTSAIDQTSKCITFMRMHGLQACLVQGRPNTVIGQLMMQFSTLLGPSKSNTQMRPATKKAA